MSVLVHSTTAYRRFPEDVEMTAGASCRKSPKPLIQKTQPNNRDNSTTAYFWDIISAALEKLYPIEMTRSVSLTHF